MLKRLIRHGSVTPPAPSSPPHSDVCLSRGPSVKRSSGMERSQSSTWDSSDRNKNKLVKAASTSKLLAKAVKNADKYATLKYTPQRPPQVDSLPTYWTDA